MVRFAAKKWHNDALKVNILLCSKIWCKGSSVLWQRMYTYQDVGELTVWNWCFRVHCYISTCPVFEHGFFNFQEYWNTHESRKTSRWKVLMYSDSLQSLCCTSDLCFKTKAWVAEKFSFLRKLAPLSSKNYVNCAIQNGQLMYRFSEAFGFLLESWISHLSR